MRLIGAFAALAIVGCAAAGGSSTGKKKADAATTSDTGAAADVAAATDTAVEDDLGAAPDTTEPADTGPPEPLPDTNEPDPEPDTGPVIEPDPVDTGWGPEQCPDAPDGVTKGYKVGNQMAELKLQDCDGNDVFLSDFCGATGTWIFAAHGW